MKEELIYSNWYMKEVCESCKKELYFWQVTLLEICPHCGYHCIYLGEKYSVRDVYKLEPFLFFFKRKIHLYREIKRYNNAKIERE